MRWELSHGVVDLPDGARLRGRGLRAGEAEGTAPEWSLVLLGTPAPDMPWPHRWLRWRDFWLPGDRADARDAFQEAHARAVKDERVEIACHGGRGRTGTAIACIAQLAGAPSADAVRWTREHYDAHAVETPWQRRYVRRFLT